MAQSDSELVSMLEELKPVYVEYQKANQQNLLNTVSITMDKDGNRIYFKTPHRIEGVNITIKDRGEKIVIQQNNVTINKNYSISFAANPGRYTVILQKQNHLLVERLEKG
ncbi:MULTISPECIES: DUF3244 domain-containing protein [unclassified Aureispira]|uniref:DUF3244 domain-containing protein n=1 Tax=unclassified Aureispira TaxID=2649989 RepID=UPI0018CC2F04|nr:MULTISPECIES: DUF3244 domain-containing protein [unclassified Aureispira]WMX14022.1 DUF3244 domain-containing protein [Aureispira sp. CCB-E]